VDDLAEKPGLGRVGAHARQHPGPEGGVHGVRGVEAPTVRAAVQPMGHDARDVVGGGVGLVAQACERPVALEDARPGAAGRVPVDVDELGGVAVRAVAERLADERVVVADVGEHAVEHQSQAALAARGDEGVELGVAAEPGVDAVLVEAVVAVRLRGEDRAEQEAGGAEVDGVVQPRQEPEQARPGFGVGVADRCAAEPQRVDVPPQRVLGQVHPDS